VLDDAIIAAEDLAEGVAEFFGEEVGEETEMSEVDAEDGALGFPHLAADAEDGTVAPEDDDEVGFFPGESGVFGPAGFEEFDTGPGFDEGNELLSFLDEVGESRHREEEEIEGRRFAGLGHEGFL
jgi:hypothetical protein